ncbi:hypothetical protein B0A50_00162 [Salinomyces thailandicus]|uniref:Ubiquinone biosynthesis O-methyltransferase, mitochondrial n=1 Tax=Salinomyces thailandicus TaxID=706561 RepID=A0A4U0UGS7_9PEZI|nr:hypothetical protein B0A50_00162 [Salinomyces thailandica]
MASTCPTTSRLLQLPAAVRRVALCQTLTPTVLRASPIATSFGRDSPATTITNTQGRRDYATAQANPPPTRPQTPSSSSVNETEVSHFSALASSWWDPHGSSRLLHLMNPLRHDFIRTCLAREAREPGEKLRYLDIGCGGGIFAESAARMRNSAGVVAVDPTPEVIAVAKQHARQDPTLMEPGNLQYINTAIENLDQHLPDAAARQFDIVTLFEVIEHIQHPAPFLRNCLDSLKPGGWLIGSTIARHPVSWFTTKFMAEDVLGLVPRGTHDWNQYIQPHELRDWARQQPELSTSDGPGWQMQGVIYVPGLGWKQVDGSETIGNYFFGVKKRGLASN